MAGYLYRSSEIVLQARCQGIRADLDDALVRPFHFSGVDRNRTMRATDEIGELGILVDVVRRRHATQVEPLRTLHDEHAQRAFAGYLQSHRTVKLEALCDESRCRRCMTQDVGGRPGIVMALQHSLPGTIELHQCAPDGQVFEYERYDGVPGRHAIYSSDNRAFRIWLTCPGLALPPVSFMTCPTKKPSSFSLPAR